MFNARPLLSVVQGGLLRLPRMCTCETTDPQPVGLFVKQSSGEGKTPVRLWVRIPAKPMARTLHAWEASSAIRGWASSTLPTGGRQFGPMVGFPLGTGDAGSIPATDSRAPSQVGDQIRMDDTVRDGSVVTRSETDNGPAAPSPGLVIASNP